MAYEALARKYRPRTFDEVVGQDPIVRTLENALREKRIHHAYVFSGVRGVGKTTIARIFAKALNCEKGPTPTPCLKCDPCREIAAGRDLDVIEMDAASRTGVDDVRDLIDTTRYAPARDRYKVFIIDEFHMLSKPAFNALLKTLEEPPARVVFLMATTELHKVLPTVLSRTQQFDFRKVGVQEIADQLAMIAKAEKVAAPRAALEMLARSGDGSVRDAESLLDQAIAFCGSELREAEVRTLLGLVPEETVEAFLGGIADKDAGALVRMIAASLAEGHDLRIFHAGLIEGVRRLLVLKCAAPATGTPAAPQERTAFNPSEILGLGAEDEARLAALAERFSADGLLRAFSVLAALEAPLKYSDQPRYLLEAAAIRLAAITELAPIEELLARLDVGEPPRTGPPSRSAAHAPSAAPARSTRPEPAAPSTRSGGPARRTRSEAGEAEGVVGGPSDAPPPALPVLPVLSTLTAPPDDETPFDAPSSAGPGDDGGPSHGTGASAVDRFFARVRERKEALAMLVENAASVFLEGRRIVVLFDDSQTFLRKSAEQPANVALLKEIGISVLGPGGSVEIRRGDAPPRADAVPTPPAPSAPARETAHAPAPAVAEPEERDLYAASRSDARRDAPGQSAEEPRAEKPAEELTLEPPAPAAEESNEASVASAEASSDLGAPAPHPASAPPGITGARYQRLHAQALEDPVVKSIVSRFGGRIVEIKEVP